MCFETLLCRVTTNPACFFPSCCGSTAYCTSNTAPAVAAKHTQSTHHFMLLLMFAMCYLWLSRVWPQLGFLRIRFRWRASNEVTEAAIPICSYHPWIAKSSSHCVQTRRGPKTGRGGWCHKHTWSSDAERHRRDNHRQTRRMGKHSGCSGWMVGQRREEEIGGGCAWLHRLWRDAVSTLIASPQDANLRRAGAARH